MTTAAAMVAATEAVAKTAAAVVTVAAAAVIAMTAVAATIVCAHAKHSNPLTAALHADEGTGAPAVPATTVSFQRLRLQRHADLPAVAHAWLRCDRAVATGATFLSLSSFSSPLSSSHYSSSPVFLVSVTTSA